MGKKEKRDLLQSLVDEIPLFMNKRDEYGEERAPKIGKKMKASMEVADLLGLDPVVTAGIVCGEELMRTAYGEVGKNYLRKINPNFSKTDFAKRIMEVITYGIESDEKKAILEGIERLEDRKDTTPEQKLAFMIIDGFDYADALPDQMSRTVCFVEYKNKIVYYSQDARKLVGPTIPPVKNPRSIRKPVNEKVALKSIKGAIAELKSDSSLAFDGIKEIKKGLDSDVGLAYYVLALSEDELEKIAHEHGENEIN